VVSVSSALNMMALRYGDDIIVIDAGNDVPRV